MYKPVEYDPLLDEFKCELCNGWFSSLSHHIPKAHGIKTSEYRKMFGLCRKTPLCTLSERQKRSAVAKKYAVLEKFNAGPDGKKHKFKKGDNTIQSMKKPEEVRVFYKKRLPKLGLLKRIELGRVDRKYSRINKIQAKKPLDQ